MLTTEQKKAHDAGMTGSKIARIITGKFGGSFAVWHEMKGLYQPPEEYSLFLEIGNALEPVVLNNYAKESGNEIVPRSTIYFDADPWYRVHIDREIHSPDRPRPGVAEGKAANIMIASKDWHDGTIPHYPLVQCLFGMFVTGFRWGTVSVISGLYEITHHTIEYDEDIVGMMIEEAIQFRRILDADTPPEVDGSDVTTNVINKIYPNGTKDMLTIDTPMARELAHRLNNVKALEKLVVNEKQRLENVFKLHLADHEGAHIPMFGNITWKNTEPKKLTPMVDIAQLKKEFPEAYEKCVTWQLGKSHRRFLVQPDKQMVDPAIAEDTALCVWDNSKHLLGELPDG